MHHVGRADSLDFGPSSSGTYQPRSHCHSDNGIIQPAAVMLTTINSYVAALLPGSTVSGVD